ncbi:hypothetical protein BVRB_5g105430 [Beta vulgaris subsp. vulgaris]|nr:hypothetical protein BVRB_5g105430 [Beta vulgaris subsp. vulgaris]
MEIESVVLRGSELREDVIYGGEEFFSGGGIGLDNITFSIHLFFRNIFMHLNTVY